MFHGPSSAGNPGYHLIIGIKIKSYYQTMTFWWKLNLEKAVVCSKNGSVFSNPVSMYQNQYGSIFSNFGEKLLVTIVTIEFGSDCLTVSSRVWNSKPVLV